MNQLVPILLSGVLTFIGMPIFIKYFQNKKLGQTTREDGPLWHEVKTGTPTMGGTVFIAASILSIFILALIYNRLNVHSWMIILTLLLFGGIGFIDDFISIFKKQNEGLTAKQKFGLQTLFAFFMIMLAYLMGEPIHINFLGMIIENKFVIALFAMLWVNGFSNAVNLTDGLDGLATGLNIIAYGAYAIIAAHFGNLTVSMACMSIVGALCAFLYFNHKPAKIFMGDVGSLALGAGLAVISIILNRPWSLLVIGIVFVIETLSVILQVISFKTRGKRIFKMSPIHHHFEMSGWSESKVVYVFWGVGLLLAMIMILVYLY